MYNIKSAFIFNGLNECDKDKIIKKCPEPICFLKGENVYSYDNFKRAIGIVLSGVVAAYSANTLRRNFEQGDVFGAAAVFGAGEKYLSKVTAKTDCKVFFIPEEVLWEIINEYPEAAVNYISFLSDKIRFLNEKLAQFTCKDNDSKLYRHLCDSAKESQVTVKSMSSLASLTGMGRTSIYRSLDNLKKSGMISVIKKDGQTEFSIKIN